MLLALLALALIAVVLATPMIVPAETVQLKVGVTAGSAIAAPGGIGGPSRLNLTFLVEGQLFPQEEILSGKGGAGLQETAQESGEIQTDVVKGQEGMRKGFS